MLRSTGSSDAMLDNLFINAKPLNLFSKVVVQFSNAWYPPNTLSIITKASGETNIYVLIAAGSDQGITFSSQLSLDINLHTLAGIDHPKLIQLE